MGMINLGDVFGKNFGKQKKMKKMSVKESHAYLLEEETEKLDDEEINLKIQKLELNDHKKCLAISAKTHKNFDMLKEIIKKILDVE